MGFLRRAGGLLFLAGLVLLSTACKSPSSERERLECTLDSAAEICVVHRPEALLCDSYKEYVTTYNYLLNKKGLSLTKDQVSRLAFSVASACNGAAGRFIPVFDVLVLANVTFPEATALAQDLARASDESARTFVEVFRFAFLASYLDLPLPASIRLARQTALGPGQGSRLKPNEFKKLVEFCLDKDGLGFGRPECARLAADIMSYDVDSQTRSVGSLLIALMDFLRTDPKGPQLASQEALKIAQSVMKVHVEGGKNFIAAYKFASDKEQLALNRHEAIAFARRLASLSRLAATASSKPDLKTDPGNPAAGPEVR